MKFGQKPGEVVLDVVKVVVSGAVIFLLLYAPQLLENGLQPFKVVSSRAQFLGVLSPQLTYSIGWMNLSLTHVGLALILSGVVSSLFSKRVQCGILLAWSLLFILYLGNISIATPRYLLPAMLPLLVFAGAGLSAITLQLQKWSESMGWVIPTLVLIIIAYLMISSIIELLDFRKDYCGPKEFSLAVGKATPENARIMGIDEDMHYIYYAGRERMGRPITNNNDELRTHFREVKDLLESGVPVYVTDPQGLAYTVSIPLGYDPTSNNLFQPVSQDKRIVYENIGFNQREATFPFYDKETKITVPTRIDEADIYTISLFNEFEVTPVVRVENEDWHRRALFSGRQMGVLYQIKQRSG